MSRSDKIEMDFQAQQQPLSGSIDTAARNGAIHYENIRGEGHATQYLGHHYYTTTHYHEAQSKTFRPSPMQTLNPTLKGHRPPTKEAIQQANNKFLRACGEGQSSAQLDLLRKQGAEIDHRDRVNCTPLHHAAFEGRLNTARYLLNAGADLHALDFFFGTPLCLAAIKGHLAIVNLFLEHNVNLAQDCEHFGTAAHAACAGGSLEVVRALANNGANFKAKAWISGVPETILEKGFKTVWQFPTYRELSLGIDRAKGFMHVTPGAAALTAGKSATVEFCLDMEHGLSVSEVAEGIAFAEISRVTTIGQKSGAGLAMVAATELDPQLMGLLLARGCDATAFDSDRESALSMAVGSAKGDEGFEACVRLLLHYGSNIDARHEDEATALMLAVRRACGLTRAQVLIGMGASVDLVDAKGESALMHAIRHAPMETRGQYVGLLCQHGADVNRKNNSGHTALDLAKERTGSDYGEVQSILLRYGAGKATSQPLGYATPGRYGGYVPSPTAPTNQVAPGGRGTMRTLSMALLALANQRSGYR